MMLARWCWLAIIAVCTETDAGAIAEVLADPAPVADHLVGQVRVVQQDTAVRHAPCLVERDLVEVPSDVEPVEAAVIARRR